MSLSNAPFERHCDTLKNGLKVVTIEAPHLHSALASVHVRVGSRHESTKTNGVTHFLEHVLFRGSESFPNSILANGLVEDAGGSLNGMTLRDQCAFDTPIHPTHLDLALRILGDMVARPLFEGVELEREIILEEMMDEVDVTGRDIDAANLVMKLVYGAHPLGLKVAGTSQTMKALTEADLRTHHARFFNGTSMVLAVAGPISRQKVLDLAQENFLSIPQGALPLETPPVILPLGPNFDLVDLDESQTDIAMSFPCPPESHSDFFPLTMVRAILDDSITSWLQREVVEARGLAYSIRAGMELFSDAGTFDIEATCTPTKVLPLVDATLAIFQKLTTEPVPSSILERILARRRIALDFNADDLPTLINCLGAPELFRTPDNFEENLDALARVTPEEIMDVSRRTFTPGGFNLCAVGPRIGRSKKNLAQIVRTRLGNVLKNA